MFPNLLHLFCSSPHQRAHIGGPPITVPQPRLTLHWPLQSPAAGCETFLISTKALLPRSSRHVDRMSHSPKPVTHRRTDYLRLCHMEMAAESKAFPSSTSHCRNLPGWQYQDPERVCLAVKPHSREAPASACLPLGRYVHTHPRLAVTFQPLCFKKQRDEL